MVTGLISLTIQDVVRGKRDHLGVHNTGNVVLTTQEGNGYIVVDGQQRITTTMLLLTALRHVKSCGAGGFI